MRAVRGTQVWNTYFAPSVSDLGPRYGQTRPPGWAVATLTAAIAAQPPSPPTQQHPPTAAQGVHEHTDRLLSNGTCVPPVRPMREPLAADISSNDGSGTAGPCQGSDCCAPGIDANVYCSPGEPTSVACRSVAGCPKGQFCAKSGDCRMACLVA